jgi:DnaJ-class molecular chaperone
MVKKVKEIKKVKVIVKPIIEDRSAFNCPECKGLGLLNGVLCPRCQGTGKI